VWRKTANATLLSLLRKIHETIFSTTQFNRHRKQAQVL